MLLATKWMNVFGHFSPIFWQKIDPKCPGGNFFPKRIHQKIFQLKIPIFSKSDDDTTWWPNSYKTILTCGQLRNTQRYQKYVRLVRAFFVAFRKYMFKPTVSCTSAIRSPSGWTLTRFLLQEEALQKISTNTLIL